MTPVTGEGRGFLLGLSIRAMSTVVARHHRGHHFKRCKLINSRDTKDLIEIVRKMADNMIADCKRHGIDIIITSTYRDNESQNALYAQGRTTTGKIVTNAKAGQSMHNYKCAFDVVPVRNGKPVWGTSGEDGKLWAQVGAIGEACGLEWAGRWVKFKELAHFQYTGGLTLKDLQAGKRII